jgi:hypothetical protein
MCVVVLAGACGREADSVPKEALKAPTDTAALTASTAVEVPAPPSRSRPTSPRTALKQVALVPQVYLDASRRVAHRKGCSEVTRNMPRTPLSAAKLQNYEIHPSCEGLASVEYRTVETVNPDWVLYEREIARNEQARLPVETSRVAEVETAGAREGSQCLGRTKHGARCSRRVRAGQEYCWQHD